jgi:hypothetical protein
MQQRRMKRTWAYSEAEEKEQGKKLRKNDKRKLKTTKALVSV